MKRSYQRWLQCAAACTALALAPLCAKAQSATDGPTSRTIGADSSLDAVAKDQARAENDLKSAEAELRDARDLLRSSGRLDTSPETLHQAAAKLEDELETLQLEDAGAKARQKALDEAFHELDKSVRKAIGEDAVVQQLEQVVAARKKQVQMAEALTKQAAAPQSQLDDAKIALAEAQVRLAEQQRQAAQHAGGESLTAWQRELRTLSINDAERSAKMKYLQDRLEWMSKSWSALDQVENARDQVRRARTRMDEAETRARKVREHAGISTR